MRTLHGQVLAERRASALISLVLGILILCCSVIPGLALAASDDTGAAVAGWVLVALGLLGTAALIWQQTGLKLVVREDGLEKHGRLVNKVIPWSDLSGFTYVPQQRQYYGGGLVGVAISIAVEAATSDGKMVPPQAMRVIGNDGTKILVSNMYKQHVPLIHQVASLAADHLFPMMAQRYEAGDTLAFGKRLELKKGVGLTCRGVLGGATVVPIEAVDRAAMIEARSFVVRSGGRVVARIAMQQVPSIFALIRLLNHIRSPQPIAHAAGGSGTGAIQN